jgi:hypothetical protein
VQAIALGTGAAKILVAEVEKRVAEIEEITGRIASAEAALQPLLFPRPAAIADYLSGNASLFEEDYARNRQLLDRVINHILVLADGSIVVQFREASLFEPVRFCRLPTTPAPAQAGERGRPSRSRTPGRRTWRSTSGCGRPWSSSSRPSRAPGPERAGPFVK